MFQLTAQQKNIWNLRKFYPGTGITNICSSVIFDEWLDEKILEDAVQCVMKSQAGLRLSFAQIDDGPMQEELPYEALEIKRKVFSGNNEFEEYAESIAKTPLEINNRFLIEVLIIEVGQKNGLLVKADHLIGDAWSGSLFVNQVYSAYQTIISGSPVELGSYSYEESVLAEEAYYKSEKFVKDRTYWQEQYHEAPEVCSIRPETFSTGKIEAKRYASLVSPELTKKILDFSKTSGFSPAVIFETAVAAYLSKINRETSISSYGILVLNRSGRKERNTAGMYISTLPLMVDCAEERELTAVLRDITKKHMEIFRHQKYPYSFITEDVRERFHISHNLYEVIVSYQNATTDIPAESKWFSNGYCEVPLEIHIDNRDREDSFTLNLDYQTERFSDGEIELLRERLLYIIDQITSKADAKLSDIDIVPASEKELLLVHFNDSEVSCDLAKTVPQAFAEIAQKAPEKAAIVFQGKAFSYAQIDKLSNSLAHALQTNGVGPGSIVPIISKRSWHVIVAMLGVLKAGGAYMPVDPAYPKDRIDYMFETAQCTLALTFGFEGQLSVERIVLDTFDFTANQEQILNSNNPEDLCYIIFTSGSTGKPKGVSITHRNVINYSNDNDKNVCHGIMQANRDTIISVTNIIFDIFVTESILPLLNGITIYFADDNQVLSQKKIADLISENKISTIQTTPTKMRSYILDKENIGYLKNLRSIVLGGEALPRDLYDELHCYTDARIFNIYGPAETTVWSTNNEVTPEDIGIGRPIANTQVYILDKKHALLPIGVAGELCIAGEGVGNGYLNRPDLTAERFIPNPFALDNDNHGKIMYCTGDLARWKENGKIEYLGRIDTQVKIRGLRIELSEIESVISQYPGIQLVAVTDKKDENGRQYLVGYYTSETKIDEKELRTLLLSKLPNYMVPNYFMHLDQMPMTASGKTDRKNLPAPNMSADIIEYVAPKTEMEERLAEIWQNLLSVGRVGRHDDFFDMGGDSLLAIALIQQIEKEFMTEPQVKDIYECSDLEGMARLIESGQTIAQRIESSGATEYELLPQQLAIYSVCIMNPDTLEYNIGAEFRLTSPLDKERLQSSLNTLIYYHPELSTSIELVDDKVIGKFHPDIEVVLEDYAEDKVENFLRPFNLSQAPLFRCALTPSALLVDIHHIIADGRSLGILMEDLATIYNGKLPLKPVVSYADYASHFSEIDFSAHKAFYQNFLNGYTDAVSLPEVKGKKDYSTVSCGFQLDNEAIRYAKKTVGMDYSDTMLFFAAYAILMGRFSNKKDFLTSIILSNRTYRETQDVVGMFANTLPVAVSVKGSMQEYLDSIRHMIFDVMKYQELPFFNIASAMGDFNKNASDTIFVYQGEADLQMTLDSNTLKAKKIDSRTAKVDLLFEITPNENGALVSMEFNPRKYTSVMMNRMFDAYRLILLQFSKDAVEKIEVVSPMEKNILLNEFNDTHVHAQREKCVQKLFVDQAKQNPLMTALVFEGQNFTYSQLDQMSNALAWYLKRHGAKRNKPIPLVSTRSWHLIVGMLGILKAGGAYMPVDPSYPEERINYMIKTAEADIALTYGFKGKLQIDSISLEQFDYSSNTSEILFENSPEDICYVIFTSGSTGRPKGIQQTHRCITNLLEWQNTKYPVSGMVIDAATTFAFDVSVQELLLSLTYGGTIILPSDSIKNNIGDYITYLNANNVDMMFMTPSFFNAIWGAFKSGNIVKGLKAIFFAGEAFALNSEQKEILMNAGVHIVNQYGPAETHVVTNKEIIGDDITIGKPISNTQIYILDENQCITPIGVEGELCIAGDGVGKGYLNRPDLTGERFVENPFATVDNGHGKIMYHSGDLACWREDGEIEYLGRIDTQVKIRGLRIELSEIESVMTGYPGVLLAAVADKRDKNGRQYLVGYYTVESEVNEKELRRHLGQYLPKYMVPNYFMCLERMPLTASGKIDRKKLPVPNIEIDAKKYTAPINETEEILCNVVAELFQLNKIGTEDDFFELGGDSLKAIEYMAKANVKGVKFELQDVFNYPTVHSLSQHMKETRHKQKVYDLASFEKYNEILRQNVINDRWTPIRKNLGTILLTGGTGFLGAHILYELVKEESGDIYCLVRGGEQRLKDTLNYYFGEEMVQLVGTRIRCIVGDITDDHLISLVPMKIDTIIHAAATVKHYGSYDYFDKINVKGTQHLLDVAQERKALFIHISTSGVSGFSDTHTDKDVKSKIIFDEQSLYANQPLKTVYVRSKFEAECKVLDAILNGLDAKIIRVGYLTNRVSDFKFQPNYESNDLLNRIRAIFALGVLPDYLMDNYIDFSPVDITATGVVKIAQYAKVQNMFHLYNDKRLYFDRFVDVLKQLEIPINVITKEEFAEKLWNQMKAPETEFIYEAFQNDLDSDGRLSYKGNVTLLNDFTIWFMKQIGFEWPEIDMEYIKGYIDYFKKLGYLS